MLSALLAVIMAIGLIPMGSVTVKAETKNATLSNLGALGTVKIGSKSESGTWYRTEVAGTPVFCLDLGKACHAGDVYESSDATYSSDSKNEKKALEAKIGHWYSVTKNKAAKAWVYAQALMWACEEGETSEKKLTDVISQVRKNTGYYDSKSAATLYDEIFKISATVSCKIKIWKYGGSGKYRQVLLEIVGNPIIYGYELTNDTLVYRQRITIDKTDEDGNPVSQVPFEVTAQNYKELYDYKVNGWGDAESGDADGESVFTSIAETDSKGRITYKFNYQIQSKNYGYVKASDLNDMTADDKKKIKEEMDDANIKYASNLTKIGVTNLWEDREVTINRWQYSKTQQLMEIDLDVANKSYDGINKYKFSAMDLKGNNLKCEVMIEEDDWIVLRISDIPKRWSDVSLRMEMPDGTGDRLKLYTNVVDVERVTELKSMDKNGYMAQKFNIEISNMQKEVKSNNKQIDKLNNEIAEVQKEIERINKEKIYQTDKEKTESDTLIAEANSTITSKQKDIQELMADIDEINKRIDMKNKEKSDLGL